MHSARTGSAIAEVSATLTTEFDLPALLSVITEHARTGYDAYSAAVVLLDRRQSGEYRRIRLVATAQQDGAVVPADLHTIGPALVSANDGAVSMIDDIAQADDTRWPEYRSRALAAGMRAVRAFPIVSLQIPLGSIVIHTEDPWGSSRPSTFGQILADLTAVAMASGVLDDRRVETTNSIEVLLDEGMNIASATGMLAEVLGLEVGDARRALSRLAVARDMNITAYARAIIAAHDAAPSDTEPAWARPPAKSEG